MNDPVPETILASACNIGSEIIAVED